MLGETGTNYAAGMSGGIADVYDPDRTFPDRVNTEMVSVDPVLEEPDCRALERLLRNHVEHSGSDRAATILDSWQDAVGTFWRVLPDPYAEALAENPEVDVRRDLPAPPRQRVEVAAD